MGTFHFEPSARLQQFLGRELVADPNVAIAEFVKNSYDAGASHVVLIFDIANRDRPKQELTIADNGVGMNRESFEQNWMQPGYSQKSLDPFNYAPGRYSLPAARRAESRVPIGEKGIGRLAAGRLGERVDVFTRERITDPWLHVVFEWKHFESMTKLLREIPVPYDETSVPEDAAFDSGTIVRISQLSLDWRGKVPGRKVSGRSDLRMGRLREDLSVLVQPLSDTDLDFAVELRCDDKALGLETGTVQAGEPDWHAYRMDFHIKQDPDGRVRVHREIQRSPDVAEKTDQPGHVVYGDFLVTPTSPPGYEDDMRPQDLRCGPFRAHFLYTTVPWKRRGRIGVPPGVLVYRDRVRVPPYGDADDDWLGARARKASRQGYAIQPDSLWGQILITKADNKELTDMSNRSGLVENDAYEDFVGHARAEFRFFSDLVHEEFIQGGWEPKERRAARQAETVQNYQRTIAHLYVHRLRGPLGAVRLDVQSSLRLLEKGQSDELIDRIRERLARADKNISELDCAIETFFATSLDSPPEPSEFDLREVTQEAIGRASGLADSSGLAITSDLGPRSRTVVMPRGVVIESIAVLLNNAIEVERPLDRRPGTVHVRVYSGGRAHQIDVIDDGCGMNRSQADALFIEARTTKGRMGVGLINSRQALRVYGADIGLNQTGDDGTTFYVTVPTVGLQRKEIST